MCHTRIRRRALYFTWTWTPTFDDNLRAFIKSCESGTLLTEDAKTPDGTTAAALKVKEIKCINLKEFSANAIWWPPTAVPGTTTKYVLRGKLYLNGTDSAAAMQETIQSPLRRGVSRLWIPIKADGFTFVRCCDCKS